MLIRFRIKVARGIRSKKKGDAHARWERKERKGGGGGGSRVSSHGCKRGTRQDTMVIGELGRLVIDVGGLSPFFSSFRLPWGTVGRFSQSLMAFCTDRVGHVGRLIGLTVCDALWRKEEEDARCGRLSREANRRAAMMFAGCGVIEGMGSFGKDPGFDDRGDGWGKKAQHQMEIPR